jgi:hypothetical protein
MQAKLVRPLADTDVIPDLLDTILNSAIKVLSLGCTKS